MSFDKLEAARLEQEEAALDPQMRNHLNQKWQDSREFADARAAWLRGPNARGSFDTSPEFANGRYLFRKRINAGGDGNDG